MISETDIRSGRGEKGAFCGGSRGWGDVKRKPGDPRGTGWDARFVSLERGDQWTRCGPEAQELPVPMPGEGGGRRGTLLGCDLSSARQSPDSGSLYMSYDKIMAMRARSRESTNRGTPRARGARAQSLHVSWNAEENPQPMEEPNGSSAPISVTY